MRFGQDRSQPAKGVRSCRAHPASEAQSRRDRALWKDTRAVAEEGEHPTGLPDPLLLLTGFRRMEASGLEPAWLDEEEECDAVP